MTFSLTSAIGAWSESPPTPRPEAYDVPRDTGGFQGVAITDLMKMGAVAAFDQPGIKISRPRTTKRQRD